MPKAAMALAQATVRAETKMLANFIVAVLWCIRLLYWWRVRRYMGTRVWGCEQW